MDFTVALSEGTVCSTLKAYYQYQLIFYKQSNLVHPYTQPHIFINIIHSAPLPHTLEVHIYLPYNVHTLLYFWTNTNILSWCGYQQNFILFSEVCLPLASPYTNAILLFFPFVLSVPFSSFLIFSRVFFLPLFPSSFFYSFNYHSSSADLLVFQSLTIPYYHTCTTKFYSNLSTHGVWTMYQFLPNLNHNTNLKAFRCVCVKLMKTWKHFNRHDNAD